MNPQAASPNTTTSDNGWFRTTHWTVVLDAGGKSTQAHTALARLCQTYWFPLYTYIRRSGHNPEDAKDLTQEFFSRLLEKDYLKAVDREKGKFRSFLLMAVKRFLANEWDHANRQKRGGGREIISLDVQDTENRYLCEPVEEMSPEKIFERQWVTALLDQVMAALEAEFSADGKAQLFKELKPLLSGETDKLSYNEISLRVGVGEGALRVTVCRLRQRYRELLRLEIANTVESPTEVDDEIRYLFSAVS